MKTIVAILTFIFYSCSIDKKHDNNVVSQRDIVSSLDSTITKMDKHPYSIPLMVLPGKGVNNIRLGTSDYNDILDFNIEFAVDSGESISCGNKFSCHSFWKRYSNDDNKLLIEYSSECFNELNTPDIYTRKLYRINIKDNPLASLKNGIRIGISTYSDVIKIYESIPKGWKNKNYLCFDKEGISFRFDSNSKLSEVEIFKPSK
jgi:hypothetical protein